MPLYEYECEQGHRFEEIQKFADDPIEHCPTCDAKAKRLMSASNFALKGEGWYRDGYTKKESKPAAENQSSQSFDDTNFKDVAERTRKAVLKREYGIDT